MKLVICEKPKVAQKMAAALADKDVKIKRKNSISYYEVEKNGEKLVVVAAVGHVYNLVQKEKTSGYPVFDIEWKPAYEVNKDAAYTEAYIKTIESLAKGADDFISACDYDLEGSLIAYNVIRFACKSEEGKRMKFSALTKGDLVKAYDDMTDLDYVNAYAGEARHILDWFYGINLSRALMEAIRKHGIYKIMSIGRVQGPALAILAKREKKIQTFEPKPYWEVWALAKDVKFMHAKNRFIDPKAMETALKSSTNPTKVIKVSKKAYDEKPYPPFDLTSLQTEAYKVFKLLKRKWGLI